MGRHRLDIVAEDTIVVELKAIKDVEGIHFAIVRSYLKAMGEKARAFIEFCKGYSGR